MYLVNKISQTTYEIFQKYKKGIIIVVIVCFIILCIIFLQSILFFVERSINIAANYYRRPGGIIYLISIPILIILPIIYALLYIKGFETTSIQILEKIKLRYLLPLHAVISFFALWRGGDKWVGADLPVYFSIVNSIAQDLDLIIWSIFNNPNGLNLYLIGEPVAFFLLAGIVALGFPVHFISVVSIMFSVANLSIIYKILHERFEEATATIGALIYIFSPVILKFEADLIKNLFAITFGLLAFYFWGKKAILTSIFLSLCVATHIVTASLFFLLLLNLAREERCLKKFVIVIAVVFLLLLPFWLIIDPYTIYYISIGRFQILVSQGTFLEYDPNRRGFFPHWPDALIFPTIRIFISIGLFLVYYVLNYQNIPKRHWSMWIIVTIVLVILGYIFPLLHPERWAYYLGFALMFLIAPSLKLENKSLFMVFLIGCYIAFAAHLLVAY